MDKDRVIGVISTDWHLQQSNIAIVKDLIDQQIKLAQLHDCKTLLCLGDVFDSRISQREEVLNAFTAILDMIRENHMCLGCIPGNHDKTDYKSDSSFLDPFYHHPAFHLHRTEELISIQDLAVGVIPFYDTEIWLERYEKLRRKISENGIAVSAPKVLLSHTALTGSVNNDGSKVISKITPKLLKETFTRVYLGHYHNAQEVSQGIYHLSSIRQNNFGEDPEKGFWLLYDDGEVIFEKARFKEYRSFKVDLDNISKSELVKLAEEQDTSNSNVKIEFIGSESKLKSLADEIFTEKGIIVKKRRKDIECDVAPVNGEENNPVSRASMKDVFKKFCDEKKYDFNAGYNFLKKYVE